MKFLAWLLSLLFAFNLGSQSASTPRATDEELRNKVQEHIDVIVDEGAALVDDVTENIRNDERVKNAEQLVQDVQDITKETLDDLNKVYEDTKNRVEEKFGPAESGETETAPEEEAVAEEEAPAEAEELPEVTAEPEIAEEAEAPQDAEAFVETALEATPEDELEGQSAPVPSPLPEELPQSVPEELPQPTPAQEVKDGEPVNG